MSPKPEAHQQAQNLYFQTDLPQSKIAELLDVNRKTLYLWIKEGQWEYLKKAARQTPGVLMDQFSRQLMALNESILSRKERPFPTKEEADIQRKLSQTIKALRKGPDPSERMEEMVRFMELVKKYDLNLEILKKLAPILTEFTAQIIPDDNTFIERTEAQYHEDQKAREQDKQTPGRDHPASSEHHPGLEPGPPEPLYCRPETPDKLTTAHLSPQTPDKTTSDRKTSMRSVRQYWDNKSTEIKNGTFRKTPLGQYLDEKCSIGNTPYIIYKNEAFKITKCYPPSDKN